MPNTTRFESATALFIAMGILGTTVIPHNIYLYLFQVKTRTKSNPESKRRVSFLGMAGAACALPAAWLVDGAILVMAAAVFHENALLVIEIDRVYLTLKLLLLFQGAALTCAIALLASGFSRSTTGTLARQIVFEGFLNVRDRNATAQRIHTHPPTMAPVTGVVRCP